MNILKVLVEMLGGDGDDDSDNTLALVERRTSVRLEYHIDLTLQFEGETVAATLENLTFTGLNVSLSRELQPGLELTLVRDELGPPFHGNVQWCKERDDKYLVGIECELNEEKLINSWLLPALEQAGFKPEFAQEQRKLIRHPSHTLCVLSDGKGVTYYDVLMLDLSLGGALVECHQELKLDSIYKFRPEKSGFCCRAKVRSVHAHGERWHCSLEFQEPDKNELKEFLALQAERSEEDS